MTKLIGTLFRMPPAPLQRKNSKMIVALAILLFFLSMLTGAAVAAYHNGLF